MFEDSTFESAGRIHTRSRRWMIAAFTFNASILLACVLVPLIYLEALPPQTQTILITLPPAPHVPDQVAKPSKPAPQNTAAIPQDPYAAPRKIPPGIYIPKDPEPVAFVNPLEGVGVPGGFDGPDGPFEHRPAIRVVHQAPTGPVRISTMVQEGLVFQKTKPVYPPIAIAARVQGTVVLAATISKNGVIENLHVMGGPPLLQQAALNAVSTWRYRPYLLDGQPVEVETTVNVVFTLGR